MKTIGRIILFVVGAILIANAVPMIINNWNLLSQSGWGDFSSYPDCTPQYLKAMQQVMKALNNGIKIFSFIY